MLVFRAEKGNVLLLLLFPELWYKLKHDYTISKSAKINIEDKM